MHEIRNFDLIQSHDRELVGGKGFGLAQLTQAGLPVPPGFCITVAAHQNLQGRSLQEDTALKEKVLLAFKNLNAEQVAVRSSATDEDGVDTSFAGQQETFLGIQTEDELVDAVDQCWASLHSERAKAYREHHQIQNHASMAVVVQKLIPADVAGVLFTRDPLDPEGTSMLVEASWGLGETVVSGQVMPDRFQLDRDTGSIRQQQIGTKSVQRVARSLMPVPAPRQKVPCLSPEQLLQIADLGRRVEAFYGEPRDIEWAWVDSEGAGKLYLLQARPITTSDAAFRQQMRREEIARLRELAHPEGTVWSRFNLSESLPQPTPMTWAIVRRWLSGRGGLGMMYRDFGFTPSSAIDELGAYDLICGRPYCNLSREPLFFAGWLPYEHPFDKLKANPEKALYPQPVCNPAKAGAWFWLLFPFRLPFQIIRSIRRVLRLSRLGQTFAKTFREDIVPPFLEEVALQEQENLDPLSHAELMERLEHWIHRVLYELARESLKPTILANEALRNVSRLIQPKVGPERAQELMGKLSMEARPDEGTDLAQAIEQCQRGELSQEEFLNQFGHRGPQEMELSEPRWNEQSELNLYQGLTTPRQEIEPLTLDAVAEETKISGLSRTMLDQQVQAMQTYLGLRETAKHHLMRGYAQIRRFLLKLDRRWNLNGGIFYLVPDELPRISAGEDLSDVIQDRQRRRQVLLSLEVPSVLFSDDLDAIGRPILVPGAETLQGVPLSIGTAEAKALVLSEPRVDEIPSEPYILVCPSTDPSWVPLFTRAKGLVMETGGVLSHGAIVARELGLPAVAGLPNVLQQIQTGQTIKVDGASGVVSIL